MNEMLSPEDKEEKPSPQDLEEVRSLMRVPEILPCAFDKTVQFWLWRISFWGKLMITHYDPITNKKQKLTKGQLEKLMFDDNSISVYGKWNIEKLSYKSVRQYRDYMGNDGRVRHEWIVIDIDLNDDIKRMIKKGI